jgi:hypothetical protein
MLYKNYYYLKETLFRSILLYNLNILLLVIGIALSSVF